MKLNFSNHNLGCRRRVASGITWAFKHVDRAIILEDDCVPDRTFFLYCAELLDRYQHDPRVMVISGDNYQRVRLRLTDSYYFSRFNHCWGWATWRRAWDHYDDDMKDWPALRNSDFLLNWLGDATAARYWSRRFDETYNNAIDSWAYRWTLSCWRQGGLTALPAQNLVQNIGFGYDATHTKGKASHVMTPASSLTFPLRHPSHIVINEDADRYTQRTVFKTGLIRRTLDWLGLR